MKKRTITGLRSFSVMIISLVVALVTFAVLKGKDEATIITEPLFMLGGVMFLAVFLFLVCTFRFSGSFR